MTDVQMLTQSLTTIANIFMWRHPHPDVQAAIQTTGVNPVFFMFRCSEWEAAFIHEFRPAFHLSCNVSIHIRASKDADERVETRITWASGGGSPGEAFAVLSLQMDVAQKAAQADMVLREAAKRFKTKDALESALKELAELAKADWERVSETREPRA